MDYVEQLWGWLKGWADKNTTTFVCAIIPKERTDLKDSIDTIKPHRDYFRVWMSQMYLAKERAWFTEWYPAVHTSVSLKFASRTAKVTHVTGPTEEHTRGVKLDYAVTDLLPFSGGKVEIESGLIALKGTNHIVASISILQEFSSLVMAPLSQALDIAQKVSSGMDKLVGANKGEVALAFHREFVSEGGGAAELNPGYIAVIAGPAGEVNEASLSVKESQLHSAGKPFDKFNYMLLRIEGRSTRDDWRFPIIEESMNQSIQAFLQGKQEDGENARTAALTAAWQSPDLAPHDRRRVVDAIKAEIDDASGGGKGAVRTSASRLKLEDVIKKAMPVDKALKQPPLTRDEVFAKS